MAQDNVTFDLREPAAPDRLLPHDEFLAGLLIATALALVLLVAWQVWQRQRRRSSKHLQSARDLAYKEATSSLERIAAAEARAAAVQASLILRKYLSLAAADPALFETHEEFISRHDALQPLTETARAACTAGFARLAALKYAPTGADLAGATVVADAHELLETLHRGFHG